MRRTSGHRREYISRSQPAASSRIRCAGSGIRKYKSGSRKLPAVLGFDSSPTMPTRHGYAPGYT